MTSPVVRRRPRHGYGAGRRGCAPRLRGDARGMDPHPVRRHYRVLLLVLTFSTGIIDGICYLALDQVFTANMTGNVLILGMGLAAGRTSRRSDPSSPSRPTWWGSDRRLRVPERPRGLAPDDDGPVRGSRCRGARRLSRGVPDR
ncbi:YoaK family protein [Oerskovia sp. M15]